LSGSGESKKSDKMSEECGMHGSEVNGERIVDWKMGSKDSLMKACRIIMKWVLTNCIRIDFEYSSLVRASSAILLNFVINCVFHKIVGNILIC